MDTVELGEYEGNAKALNTIFKGLLDLVFTKVMQCTSGKQDRDKLKIIYEGDQKLKNPNLKHIMFNFKVLNRKKKRILVDTFFV